LASDHLRKHCHDVILPARAKALPSPEKIALKGTESLAKTLVMG
jgi:hypothetical protein